MVGVAVRVLHAADCDFSAALRSKRIARSTADRLNKLGARLERDFRNTALPCVFLTKKASPQGASIAPSPSTISGTEWQLRLTGCILLVPQWMRSGNTAMTPFRWRRA